MEQDSSSPLSIQFSSLDLASSSSAAAAATPASVAAVPVTGSTWMGDPDVVCVDFDLDDDYAAFIAHLRKELANNPEQADKVVTHTWLVDHPLLPEQRRPYQPARWMHIKLAIRAENKCITLAVRDDNLYLIGFMNQNGDWYEFGFNEQVSVHMIPYASFLGCDAQYSQLVYSPQKIDLDSEKGIRTHVERALSGGSQYKEVRQNLLELELGRESAKRAVRRLSLLKYRGNGPQLPPPQEVKRDLARLIIMVCESARMSTYSDIVCNGWATASVRRIGEGRQVDYIWNWGLMSGMLSPVDKPLDIKTSDRLRKIGIRYTEDALAVVKLVLNVPPAAPGGAGGHRKQEPHAQQQSLGQQPTTSSADGHRGKTMVEVFQVRANFQVIGTVSAFDGKRGQIIYRKEQGTSKDDYSQSQHQPLVLTGPYKAISAGGSFVFIADIAATATTYPSGDKSSNLAAAMYWDAYAEDTQYDRVLTHNITTSPGRSIEVTYGVLTNAVEAYVVVRLFSNMIPGWTTANPAQVHGKIIARMEAMDAESVLFSREPDEKVQVQHDQMAILPLARSIVAVPFGSKLLVKLDLHAGVTGGETISFQQDSEMNIHDGYIRMGITDYATVQVFMYW